MNLPDFSDFLNTLDAETISDILKDANTKAADVEKTKGIHAESVPGLQVQSISLTISLELLAAYHKWLEQEL